MAERFARLLTSSRGEFLYGRVVAGPVVWCRTIDRATVLAHFTDRDESEVVLADVPLPLS